MAASCNIGGLLLGEGRPKIIVSILGKTEDEVLKNARALNDNPLVQLCEWRADHFSGAPDIEKTLSLLAKIRDVLLKKPLIFTFRTAQEGGQKTIEATQYVQLCNAVAASQTADLIDVEMFFSSAAAQCVSAVHAHGGKVIGSWHNFEKTPTRAEIIVRFEAMQRMGADVLKMAVMPQTAQDVTTLMSAVSEVHTTVCRPLCAMSMGAMGCITRMAGESFGSCLTFATVGEASAPGQIAVSQLHAVLDILHESMQNGQ